MFLKVNVAFKILQTVCNTVILPMLCHICHVLLRFHLWSLEVDIFEVTILRFFFLLNMMRTTNTHSSDYYQSLDLSKIMPMSFYTELDLSDQEDNLISNFFSEVKGAKCDFYINIFLLITGTLCGPLGRMQVYINRHLLFKVIQLPCPCH